eukprot:13970696-Ditylum_brightwellii.AAC.2
MTYPLERQQNDNESGYAARKRKRKRCRSTIRRKRKERLRQDWDGNDDDDDREYKMGEKAKRVGRTQKVNEKEISPLGFINVPDQIWRNKLRKGERDFVASYNAKKQNGELIKNLIIPRRF